MNDKEKTQILNEWTQLSIGEKKEIGKNQDVVRVLGGWIYRAFVGDARIPPSVCFIPIPRLDKKDGVMLEHDIELV